MSESLAIYCIECNHPFELPAGERAWYATHKDLKTGESLQLPKRCKDCRERRKSGNGPNTPVVRGQAPQGYSKEFFPKKETKEEIKIILATTDFENLICGRPICWQGVRIILADIGFDTMQKILNQAVIDWKLRPT